MCSCSEDCCTSSNDRYRMTACGSGTRRLVPLLWLAAAAATATAADTTASMRSPVSQPPSVCQQQRRTPGGLQLRPTDFWQFVDASISAVADSCNFTIDAPPESAAGASTSRRPGMMPTAASAASYSSPRNTSAPLPVPQMVVIRLISWHPGSDCLRETCSRNSSAPRKVDGGRCAVALSLVQQRSSFSATARPIGVGGSSPSVDALFVTGGGGGTGSSSSSASASATIAWTDAALNAIVSGSGCCGARLLLGYKVAPARSACRSGVTLSTASSPPSSSSTFSSSDSPPHSDTPSHHQYSTPELVDKYTYMFAQDRKLGWLPSGIAADNATSAAACHDHEDYELVILPADAAELAKQEVRFDLLTAPTRRSCRRLCIADVCWPRLGVFNASGRRPLSVRYEYRSVVADSGGACVDHEYSGFTLRLLAPSRVQFAAFASPPPTPSPGGSYKPELVLIIALAAGAAAILIALTAVIAVLVRRCRSRQSAAPHMEMRSRETRCKDQKPFVAANDYDQDRYEEAKFNENGKRAETRDRTVENTYWQLGMAAEGEAEGAEPGDDHLYSECMK